MRREELAARASLSVDYVVRLEQGRANHPSAQVVAALSAALQLSRDEEPLLYRAAGLTPPDVGIDRRVPPIVDRLARRLDNPPVAVYSADWWLLQWNRRWAALLGEPADAAGRDRNLVWQVFGDRKWRAEPADRPLAEFRRTLVSDLRVLLVDHPADEQLVNLVEELRRLPLPGLRRAVEGGRRGQTSVRAQERRTPGFGRLLLDCDVIQVPESDVRMLVYSAEPGSTDAGRLDLLSPRYRDCPV